MNKKQEQILNKRFKVNKHISITRGDYENMPCPMLAWNWSDEKMTELAKNIKQNLYYKNQEETIYKNFPPFPPLVWAVIEKEAIKMGMRYYEDLDKKEFSINKSEWEQIK